MSDSRCSILQQGRISMLLGKFLETCFATYAVRLELSGGIPATNLFRDLVSALEYANLAAHSNLRPQA